MSSRDTIISAIMGAKPQALPLPDLSNHAAPVDTVQRFTDILTAIGGKVFRVPDVGAALSILKENFPDARRVISWLPGLDSSVSAPAFASDSSSVSGDPHDLADTDLAILRAHFGVAENGAVWITEEAMLDRALPFICQHLAILIDIRDIFADMHQAYERIGDDTYGFGTFIAGPSKTADIEQSLVLGAHGPRSMTVFLLDSLNSTP